MLPMPVWDHVVINTRDQLDAAAAVFAGLGFTLTPRGYHSLGSINHLAVFGSDYIELIGMPGGDDTRAEILGFPCGLNGLVFATEDAHAVAAAAQAAGLPLQPVRDFFRPVDLGGDRREDATFRTVNLAAGAVDYGRVYFCQHFSRHLVWRAPWQRHRNGVIGIARAVIVSHQPDLTAATYRQLFGASQVSKIAGGFSVAVALSRLDIIDADEARRQFRTALPDAAGRDTYMAALTLRTASLADAQAVLGAAATKVSSGLMVPATAAFGATLEFVA